MDETLKISDTLTLGDDTSTADLLQATNLIGKKMKVAMRNIGSLDFTLEDILDVQRGLLEEIALVMFSLDEEDDTEFGRQVRQRMRQNITILALIDQAITQKIARDNAEADHGQEQ